MFDGVIDIGTDASVFSISRHMFGKVDSMTVGYLAAVATGPCPSRAVVAFRILAYDECFGGAHSVFVAYLLKNTDFHVEAIV